MAKRGALGCSFIADVCSFQSPDSLAKITATVDRVNRAYDGLVKSARQTASPVLKFAILVNVANSILHTLKPV